MDKKKRLKYIVNKAKEESTMEKKKNDKSKSIHDIFSLDLIHRILLRTLRNRIFTSLSHPLTHACLLVHLKDSTKAYLVHLEEVFNGDNYQVKDVSFPFKKKPPSKFCVMGSCRGKLRRLNFFRDVRLYGFGYDASRDDYLVVVASQDSDCQHLDCLSLRTNSWINLDAALPESLGFMKRRSPGLFLNGSIHWLSYSLQEHYSESHLIFDLKERSFSRISLPEQLIMHGPVTIVTLGGCLAL
ncbi:uncharacterized protein DS421_17g597080 [Arachis hypogaea]|nr:uncharacterized protein DS421_17g597080 [Arachis hypogaea]